jgi:hypothetical protein
MPTPPTSLKNSTTTNPIQELTLITQNTKKHDIITLLTTHDPDILFLSETQTAKDCSVLCGIQHNHGYYTHYHTSNIPLNPDSTPPEARIPATLTHNGGGYMIAYNKKEN